MAPPEGRDQIIAMNNILTPAPQGAPLDDRRWAALLARDPTPACGAFLYGVTTQGVFCRPGCPARPPLRRNAKFFQDAAAAEAAGYRACKRCDPRGERASMQAAAIQAVCALMEAA